MANKYLHLREKALYMRVEQKMTMDQIIERLHVPKTTLWYWIKDHPIPLPPKGQNFAQKRGSEAVKRKHEKLRRQSYERGLAEAPELLKDPTFRDFVVLYMAEGSKTNRNRVEIVNSDPIILKIAYKWMRHLSPKKVHFALQYHADHDTASLIQFWAEYLSLDGQMIVLKRKSNSNRLAGRQFRSVYGLLTLVVYDTDFFARMQAWIDFVKGQW